MNSPEYRDLSPKQIVPKLADQGTYLASESSFYRILRDERLLEHRQPSRPPRQLSRPKEHTATGPNQLWSWDITYLRSKLRGSFYYLYLVLDIWSRKIVAWAVHETESAEHGAALMDEACRREGVRRDSLVLHSDNGSPMKAATLLATLQALGIVPSFSRPGASNDNPFSESLFRTAKYRPEYPDRPFESLEAAREWVAWFVWWYNTQHLHSAVRFVTPQQRHDGRDGQILANRESIYAHARQRHPERWTGATRNWTPVDEVRLNPDLNESLAEVA